MKKLLAEFLGTAALVFIGCGSAVVSGRAIIGGQEAGIGILGIALAFGLVLLAMVYAIGSISGCHVNPAVSIAMLVAGKMNGKDAAGYIVAQCAGAVIGAGLLLAVASGLPSYSLAARGLGQNGYGVASPAGYGLLACAIAEEMGFAPEQVEVIQVAGLLHDIGKLSLPQELLNKSGKLTDTEFQLIKTHSQTGYDILKSVEFPWPIADIVIQHHERMNGSGYPSGIKEDEILIEARILGVADVVEAMNSYRPYRPPLGIDKALEQISRNSGILYDPRMVDACVRLFTEKRFQFQD